MLVPDAVRLCTCFIYVRVNGEMKPRGTAFFVSVPLGETDKRAPVLVTALHVVEKARMAPGGDGHVWLRVNLTAGGSEFLKIEDDAWAAPNQTPHTVDVAACAWPFDAKDVEYLTVSTANWLTDEITEQESIGVGDDLFLTGLFVSHRGRERNVPIVRVGNIATMPGESVETKIGPMEAYLVEARSVGGLSGSPVFISMGELREDQHGNVRRRHGAVWYLLGVMHGHWQVPADVPDTVVDDGLGTEYVNMGIGIVTPIQHVVPLFKDPRIKEPIEIATRQAEAEQAESLPTMDTADEPDEFERFEDLTRKLVQTPKPPK